MMEHCRDGGSRPDRLENSLKKRKWITIYGVMLAGILLLNAFLTFQSPEETVSLSEGLRHWLERFGYRSDYHQFRSNAHLVMFFLIGILLGLFGQQIKWSWKQIILIGLLLGCIDEGIKIYLPTREFDPMDLLKDWIGVVIAFIALIIKDRIKVLL